MLLDAQDSTLSATWAKQERPRKCMTIFTSSQEQDEIDSGAVPTHDTSPPSQALLPSPWKCPNQPRGQLVNEMNTHSG